MYLTFVMTFSKGEVGNTNLLSEINHQDNQPVHSLHIKKSRKGRGGSEEDRRNRRNEKVFYHQQIVFTLTDGHLGERREDIKMLFVPWKNNQVVVCESIKTHIRISRKNVLEANKAISLANQISINIQ